MKFWVHRSYTVLANGYKSYQILREDDTQIVVYIQKNIMYPSLKLTPEEANYFRENNIIKPTNGQN